MAFQPKTTEEKILHRLQIARGHLEKVIAMYTNRDYCIDVLHQSNAVQRALKEADNLIMEHHLLTCAADAIRQGRQKEVIEEVMSVFRKNE